MKHVVFYDKDTGKILHSASLNQASLDADPRPWIEVEEHNMRYNLTHKVVAGELVAI